MYFKKLIGKKCYLSPININDAEKFTEWLNDLDVAIYTQAYSRIWNIETTKSDFLQMISKEHNYSIIDIKTDELIGNCGFLEINQLNQNAEVGLFIRNKNYWNKGYGKEALILLLDYGFKVLNLHNIMLNTYEFNKGAIKCAENVGFKKIGQRRKALYRNMEKHDIIFMDILPNEFYDKNKNF
jgi:RimJ/RimL family protein N-acetyltransferase